MQDQTTIDSSQKLESTKDRLETALLRLDGLIQEHNSRIDAEKQVRTKVIQDLDSHIANLATILKENS